jgi:hypothetical protein
MAKNRSKDLKQQMKSAFEKLSDLSSDDRGERTTRTGLAFPRFRQMIPVND